MIGYCSTTPVALRRDFGIVEIKQTGLLVFSLTLDMLRSSRETIRCLGVYILSTEAWGGMRFRVIVAYVHAIRITHDMIAWVCNC